MPDAPKQSDFFGLIKKILFFIFVVLFLLLALSAPAGGYVYMRTNQQPGSDTAKLYKSKLSTACLPKDMPAKYLPFFERAATTAGIDPAFPISVAEEESHFNPKAVSHDKAGNPIAHGIMQVTPDKIGDKSKLYDPETNISAGTRYLAAQLRNKTNPSEADLRLAVQRYNAGPGNPGGADMPYVERVIQDYRAIKACQAKQTTGSVGQKIAAEALARIGDSGDKYYPNDPGNACAAFVADVINHIPGTNARLTLVVPDNYAGRQVAGNGTLGTSLGVGGTRLVINSNFVVDAADQRISIADIRPGDYIFFAKAGTKFGYNQPQHSGIYIGQYKDMKQAVVTLSSTPDKIIIEELSVIQTWGNGFPAIGVRRY